MLEDEVGVVVGKVVNAKDVMLNPAADPEIESAGEPGGRSSSRRMRRHW